MSDPVVISSVIVLARPERLADVALAIEALPQTEVFAADPSGKLIVVLESDDDRGLADRVEALAGMAGVLSVNLVFHHTESAPGAAAKAT